MSELVRELNIIGQDNNIFDTDLEYIIPLYQRAYAWEDKQLIQLVEDINDVATDANYYIGSLIVSKQGDKYEVVDGQQRLTSLYLLLNCLQIKVKNTLTFACRDKSNYTLGNICELIQDNRSKLDFDRIEPGIHRGIKILMQELNKEKYNKDDFLKKLAKVIVYRIEVPENTDLNRYFEIMNTRGEQLEQHDILKATLMSYFKHESDKVIFAKIWDACSDMSGYVQMHFNVKSRENIFSGEWNWLPSHKWKDYKNIETSDFEEGEQCCIEDIIETDFIVPEYDILDDDNRIRFESIIEFPYFLMHTLKVLIQLKGIEYEDSERKIIDELLDDKKLIDSFQRVILHGVGSGKKIIDYKENFSKQYIICLLRTRYLFDKYIIKREYANDQADGEWSLKSLYVSGQQSKKKAYYINTKFKRSGERATKNDYRVKTNIMLQSALRVSYTSPKVMHWITELLIWLSKNNCENTDDNNVATYDWNIEGIARRAVIENFLSVCQDGVNAMGVNTPHIVFNYLDYLLWNSDRKKYDDFVFEFRNSVEHWYPQNPSEGTFEQWTQEEVDDFGNLCIIQRNVNSKFSNMAPAAKKSTFRQMIEKGSIKLRLMSEKTRGNSENWRQIYKEFGEDMIEELKNACEVLNDELA